MTAYGLRTLRDGRFASGPTLTPTPTPTSMPVLVPGTRR